MTGRTFRSRSPIALLVATAVLLAGCGTGFFGEEDDVILPGERISVLELASALDPDPAVAGLPVVLPEPEANEAWPQSGGVPSHAPQHLAYSGALTEVWSADVGEGSGGSQFLVNPPIVAGGRVFVSDAAGNVTAVSASSGDELWQVRVANPYEDSNPLGGGVAFADGLLYVTTGFGEVLALDPANGGMVWREEANSPVRAPPAVFEGRVLVVTVDNQTEAYAADTGEVLWTHSGVLETASVLGGASPATGPGVAIVPYTSGEVTALRLESGRAAWSDSLTALRRSSALGAIADIRGPPVIDRNIVIAVSHSGRLAALDLRSGARAWEQDIASIEMPWVAGDFIFVLTTDAEVVALLRDTGQIRWVARLPRWEDPDDREGPIVWAGPILAGNRLYAVGSDGDGAVIDPATGEVTQFFDLNGTSQISPIVAGGTLYILSDDGTLTAYR